MRPIMLNFIGKIERFFEDILSNTTGNLFKKGHGSFIGWFIVVFLGTLALLAAFGLLPSELMENSAGNGIVDSGERALNNFLGVDDQGGDADLSNNTKPVSMRDLKPAETGTMAGAGTAVGAGAGSSKSTNAKASSTAQSRIYIYPTKLIIPSISMDTIVLNPVSTSTEKLDYELTKGPVHYPGSGTVGFGNMFIFGHSTGWSIVQNKAYKVFNQIKTLKAGDPIYVETHPSGASGPVHTFEYRVRLVTEVNKNDTLITFDTSVNMLTLSTCDSFGAKTDRYVVTADYIGEKFI